MAQKFHQKASVQVALAAGSFALVGMILQQFGLSKENDILKEKLVVQRSEIQRLEILLTPFRTLAMEKFRGGDDEALQKLAADLNNTNNILTNTRDELKETQNELLKSKEDRVVTPEQAKKIVAALGSSTGLVYIDGDLTDMEARMYAEQIRECLSSSSLEIVKDPKAGFIQVHRKGIALVIKEGVDHPPHLDVIQNALKAGGIESNIALATVRSWNIPDDAVFIWACHK